MPQKLREEQQDSPGARNGTGHVEKQEEVGQDSTKIRRVRVSASGKQLRARLLLFQGAGLHVIGTDGD